MKISRKQLRRMIIESINPDGAGPRGQIAGCISHAGYTPLFSMGTGQEHECVVGKPGENPNDASKYPDEQYQLFKTREEAQSVYDKMRNDQSGPAGGLEGFDYTIEPEQGGFIIIIKFKESFMK